jgi:fermentation-respiration switch protein FrsA (DUF1100 family)
MPIAVPERSMAGVGHDRGPRFGVLDVAAVAGGAALAALVGVGGSVVWGAVRVLAVLLVTVTMLMLGRWASPRRELVAVVIGVPGVAIALGFAPHLAKGGPVRVQVATVVLAAATLVLTAVGALTATRGRRPLSRIGVGLAVLVALGTVAFVVGPAVIATNTPHAALGATPTTVGLAYQDVVLETEDGVSLAAWYLESSNRAAVVLLHGAGSTRSNVLEEAAVLAGAGFGVLMVDARGHGESGGRAMDFGWHGDGDIRAATAWLARRSDVDADRIGAVGSSMGGEEALGASGTNQALRAVVAEGATARVAGDEKWLSDRYGIRGRLAEGLELAQDWLTDLLTSASPPTSMRDAVAASDAEYLLITGGAVAEEGHAAEFIAAAAPDRVRTWTVPGGGHTEGLRLQPAEWTERVVGFLTRVLIEDPVGTDG